MWSSIDLCLNGDDTSGEDCTFDGQHQTAMYRVNETRLLNNNITFPCVHDDERPEILAIHLIYTCSGEWHTFHLATPTDSMDKFLALALRFFGSILEVVGFGVRIFAACPKIIIINFKKEHIYVLKEVSCTFNYCFSLGLHL